MTRLLDYLITQTIGRLFWIMQSDDEVDGIYSFRQGNGAGVNVVLFHKAARVAPIEMPGVPK